MVIVALDLSVILFVRVQELCNFKDAVINQGDSDFDVSVESAYPPLLDLKGPDNWAVDDEFLNLMDMLADFHPSSLTACRRFLAF